MFLPWILVYLSLYLLQGGGGSGVVGLLSNMRAYLWIPVTQSAYRRVSTELFSHLLDLDHSFHLHRKTGEVSILQPAFQTRGFRLLRPAPPAFCLSVLFPVAMRQMLYSVV